MLGHVVIGRDVDADIGRPGLAFCTESGRQCPVSGTITIGGDFSANITGIGQLVDVNNDLSGGHIIINGSLASWSSITVGQLVGQTRFIAIDYDASVGAHLWEPNAAIIIGGPEPVAYWQNTPGLFLWDSSECKGDLNNDFDITFSDINPFVQAISNPHAYALAFPGLGAVEEGDPNFPWESDGSRLFHADCNCDGQANALDTNAFISRLISGCCDPNCPPNYERGDGFAGGPTPGELAKLLADAIAPELKLDLVNLIRAYVAQEKDDALFAYWTEVYGELTKNDK